MSNTNNYINRIADIWTLLDRKALDEADLRICELRNQYPDLPGAYALFAHCADLAQSWQASLDRWNDCLARFPQPEIGWLMGKGWALFHLGHRAAAEEVFSAAQALEPGHFAPPVALAIAAARRGNWPLAAERWDDCFARFANVAHKGWWMERGDALVHAGRLRDATDAFREMLRADSADDYGQWRLISTLLQLDRREQALYEMAFGVLKDATTGDTVLARAQINVQLIDLPEARNNFEQGIRVAATVQTLTGYFELIPHIFQGSHRAAAWTRLEERLSVIGGAEQVGSALSMRLKIARHDYDSFLMLHDACPVENSPWRERFSRLAALLRAERYPDFAAPKIFVIGLTKTGTTSISSALETLGYLTAHYLNPFTSEMLDENDAPVFDAMSDTPVCIMFESLFYTFPNSRFIWTLRDLQSWQDSFSRHYMRWHGTDDFGVLHRLATTRGTYLHGEKFARKFATLYSNYPNLVAAHSAYAERVNAFFTSSKRSRLLLFDTFSGDGWEKLCGFLGRPVPDVPYPWENRDDRIRS
jgi:tetratricopeptide (TPR) repeat protein